MYGWIVDGISSLFEPITGQNPTEWPGKGNGEITTRAAEAQRQSYARAPAKRNYQRLVVEVVSFLTLTRVEVLFGSRSYGT